MPRDINPGNISTGPGKPVSTDTDELVLKDFAGGAGEGAYIPPGETTPRTGYPALPCRACGSGVSGSTSGSLEETILTVGQPNANAAWTGFSPDFLTLADAVTAAGLLMSPDGGNPGRAVRILVIGPTVETAVPIQIPVDGLVIEGYPGLEGSNAAITWTTNDPLIDLGGHSNLIFRDLRFEWAGSIPIPPLPALRLLFTSNSSSKMSRIVIDNCVCDGEIQGFVSAAIDGNGAGFENCQFTGNRADQLLEFAIFGFSIGADPPFSGCVIQDNVFSNVSAPAYSSFVAIGWADSLANAPNTTSISHNTISGFWGGIGHGNSNSGTTTIEVRDNFITGTEIEGIIFPGGVDNKIVGNTLTNVYTSGSGRGIYVDNNESVIDSNHVSLANSGGNAILIGSGASGTNNVCSKNDVTDDTTGRIRVEGSQTVITGNKAKGITSYSSHSTISSNIISTGSGITIYGTDSVIEGNDIANDLTIRASRCSVGNNTIGANFSITDEASDITFGDNYVGVDVTLGTNCDHVTITGNRIVGNVVEVAGLNVISDNDINGTITSNGNECNIGDNRIEGNLNVNGNTTSITGNTVRFGTIQTGAASLLCNISNNTAVSILVGGVESVVNGNDVGGALWVLTGATESAVTGNVANGILVQSGAGSCNVSGNTVEFDITVNSPDVSITGNTVLGITGIVTAAASQYCAIGSNVVKRIVSNGANTTISGNTVSGGGTPDISVNGVDCILTGNGVSGSIDINSTGCIITGNYTSAITTGGAAAAPPLNTVFVSNRAPGGTFNVPLDGTASIANNS